MSNIKTPAEIEIMREGGVLLGRILKELIETVDEGVTSLDLDTLAQKRIAEYGGKPSFMTVNDYGWATCISVNDGVVHGVPNKTPFKRGDLVSVDVGILYKGYHTDTSWSVFVEPKGFSVEPKLKEFLDLGRHTLASAIEKCRDGAHIGEVSQAIQTGIEAKGYHVMRNLVGHAIGKKLHETPQVPGVLSKEISNTPKLHKNMTMAIEVIYSMGSDAYTHTNDDGWSLSTADGSLAGLFEQTILVTEADPIVLTAAPC